MKRSGSYRNSVYVKLFAFVLFMLLICSPAQAQQIITNGNTNTTLTVNGTTTDITTTTTKGVNAFNSFSRFNVNAGNTVNLVVPGGSERLINVVKNEATNINGILNSVQNGTAGRGNIYLVNPNGIVVGATGQVNVGALTAVTPTSAFVNTFFDSPGNPNDAAVTALINGTAPVRPFDLDTDYQTGITNEGKITAQQKVTLNSATVRNYGTIELSNIVNVDKIVNGNVVGQYNGDIVINVNYETLNYGTIKAEGKDGVDGGNIDINSDVTSSISGNLITKGNGSNSNGGNITIKGKLATVIGGTYDAKGGNISGNGGNVTFISSGLPYDGNVLMFGDLVTEYNPIIDIKGGTNSGVAGNVTFNALGNFRFNNGTLTIDSDQLNNNKLLLVNANNTIDPSSSIGANIANGSINVDNINSGTNSQVNITANRLYGSETIKINQGKQNITITNNSTNNLNLNNMNTNYSTDLFINGTKVTTSYPTTGGTITVAYQDTGLTTPRIDIANNYSSNIGFFRDYCG